MRSGRQLDGKLISHLLLAALYALFIVFLSLCATVSITHNKFSRFLRIFMLGLIALGFGGFTVLVYNVLVLIGVEMDYTNVYLMCFVALNTVMLLGVLIYLQLEWCLLFVIVVVESKWGFSAMMRSVCLGRGMAFGLILLFESCLDLWACCA
ncbi:hypothetical protein AAHA92_07274 [Salvia divinorum]|uniref:NADH dehydrogenase subunit 6 n=1 Tax=Salvia divinorum TaxID=28513 RepID=A0ABD1I8F3_SALDI